MPILQILSRSPEEIYKLELTQVIALCGNGKLTDASPCSIEFREFLKTTPSSKLFEYVETCLSQSFEKSGQALQDVINELGRRLDYSVTNGLYQGRVNAIGYDGLWKTPNSRDLVIEVKTTDAYRINLDTISEYRRKLAESQTVSATSSILIIVGRQDTGDLEAQVRGSRHAWDIRLISADALIKLVKLKEETEEDTTQRIRDILIPFEYTRVDRIIEIAFTAATEATDESIADVQETASGDVDSSAREGGQVHTPKEIIESERKAALAVLAVANKKLLVKRSRATYWSPEEDHELRVACSVSKRYRRGNYWYAYHPEWDEFLKSGKLGFMVLCCVGSKIAYAIPREWLAKRVHLLNQTMVNPQKGYWHIHLEETESGELGLKLHKTGEIENLNSFKLKLP